MHPIAALMLSQAMEEERRRVIARRPNRFLEPFTEERTDSRRWLIHFSKLNLSGSKA